MILPDCLTNVVGFEPCAPEENSAQLVSLSELEGLSIGSVAATVDSDKWASARAATAELVKVGVKNSLFRLKNKFTAMGANLYTEIDAGSFCFFETKAQPALSTGDQGLQIERNLALQPQNLPIRVNFVTLKSPNDTAGVRVNIKNEAGVVLWYADMATIAANTEYEVTVGQDFYENKIRIVTEGAEMQGFYANCNKGQACCGELGYSNQQSLQSTAFYVNGIEAGIVGGFKSPGITASITLPCLDAMFCKYRERLAQAILYDTGVAVLKEWLASTRLNAYALKKDWVEKKIPEWEGVANLATESVAGFILDDLIKCNPRCFNCKQPVGYLITLP